MKGEPKDKNLLYSAPPREFDKIVKRVFGAADFETVFVLSVRDGGKDIYSQLNTDISNLEILACLCYTITTGNTRIHFWRMLFEEEQHLGVGSVSERLANLISARLLQIAVINFNEVINNEQ
ncbi:MAG: hypothetical protein J6L81_05350 [Clostridia bacterium]|nr:hypothetical protein [Clostridia bacterium]